MKVFFFSILLFTSSFINSQTLSTSLTACYSFLGNSNDPISGLNGTLSAVTPTVDRFNVANSAYRFNGVNNSYIELPDNPLLKPSNAISISCWIKPLILTTQYVVFTKNPYSTNHEAYALVVIGGKVRVQKSNGTTSNIADGTSNLNTNTWYHIAGTIDNSSVKVYVNGVLENTTPSSMSFTYQTGRRVYLGGSNESAAYLPFSGTIDNVRFYNRVLTVTEINQLYTLDPSCSLSSPTASFSLSTSTVCVGSNITLNDLSTENPNSWNWQTPGANTATSSVKNPTISFPNPGNYVISLVSSNSVGISNTATLNVVVNPNPTLAVSSSSILMCGGMPTTLTATGANSYTWNTSQTGSQVVVTPTVTSTYTVLGKDNTGCIASTTLSQLVINNPNVTISSTSQTACAGQNTTLTANGASTYSWSTNQSISQIIISPSITSTYTLVGTDNNGCSNTAIFTLTITIPTVSISSSSLIICAGKSVTLTASGSNSYTWNTNQTGSQVVVSPTATTVYSLTGFNNNSCVVTASITQLVLAKPSVSVSTSNPIICSGKSSTINANGASSYTWSTNQIGPQVVVNPSLTTTYSVIGADNNGCTNTINITQLVIVSPSVSLSPTNLTVCSGQSTTITANGATNYTWNTNQTTSQIIVNTPVTTNYSVIGFDSNGCSNTASMQLVIANPSVTISSSSSTVCSGKTITLTANGATSYTWNTNQNSLQILVSPTTNITYSIYALDNYSCSTTASINLFVIASPTINLSLSNSTICAGQTTTVSANGATSFSWNTSQTSPQIVVSPTTTTTYSITGFNTNGCSHTASITQAVISNPTVIISLSSPTLCSGQNASVTVNGADSYTWNTSQTTTQIIVSPTTTTTYSVIGVNTSGCTNTTNAQIVLVSPSITLSSLNPTICEGKTTTITANGATSYTWNTNQTTTQIVVSPTTNTTYTLIGLSSGGCTGTAAITQSVLSNPNISLSLSSLTVCAGKTTSINATGASTYTWNTNQTGSMITINPTITTTYSLIGLDNNGCSNSVTVTQSVISNPIVNITSSNPTMCVGKTTTLTASGASSYTWNTNHTTTQVTISPTTTTNYSVVGADNNGCFNTAVFTQSLISNPIITLSSSTPTSCSGTPILIIANGASSYSWSTSQTSTQIVVSPTTTTTYSISGFNNNGCSHTANITQTVISNPTIILSSSPSIICVGESCTITATGGNSYIWGSNETTSQIVVTPTTTAFYSVIGTDNNGCSTTSTITQIVDPCTGIQKKENNSFINIYPNPTSSLINIDSKTLYKTQVFISNSLGEVIYNAWLQSEHSQIDLSAFSNGIYFVRIDNLQFQKTVKLIKH